MLYSTPSPVWADESLEQLIERAQYAIRAAVRAQAYLVEGGEPTWDAVKDVSTAAFALREACATVETLRDNFDVIAPL